MKPTLALCMIVRGVDSEAPLLDNCLKSISKHVDGIFLQLNAPEGQDVSTKVRAVAEKYTTNIKTFVWDGNFVKARNANFKQVPKKYDWILWLDSDDTVDKPQEIVPTLALVPKNIGGMLIKYDYDHDTYGNITTSLWVARVVRNNDSMIWKSSFDDAKVSVHETLVPNRRVGQVFSDEFKIIHHADNLRRDQSLFRNIELLEGMYDRQLKNNKFDPRILFYLATHYKDALRYDKVRPILIEYLKMSGWAEERSEAHVIMGQLYSLEGNTTVAKEAFLRALGENSQNPSAYNELGKLEMNNKNFVTAAYWLELGLKIKQSPKAMVFFNDNYKTYMNLAECYANIGGKKLSEALKMAYKAHKLRPYDPVAEEQHERIKNLVEYADDTKAVARLIRKLAVDEEEKILPLIQALPQELEDSPIVVAARQGQIKPRKWPKKSMAIFCADGPLGIWGPWSLKEGIGGSEEAVIRLSIELEKLGWKVTVFATPGERAGIYDNVDWRQFWEFNPNDEFDVLVGWRNPGMFDTEFTARKKYLWMHDVMPQNEFFEERLDNLDKVIVLSQYQRELFSNIPDDKIFLSTNGITPEDFDIDPPERDPHKVIYMSSHVRGLELLYDMWPKVKEAVPDATLDIYYGWDSFIAIQGDNPERMMWRERMLKWERELDGVTDHGKVSQPEIVKQIYSSGVWAYPCPFPEISCITAMKAQAGGAVPVSSDFAALDETVQFGTKVHMKAQDEDTPVGRWDKSETAKFQQALIDMLKDPKRQEIIRRKMMPATRDNCSWKKVSEQWTDEMI